MNQVYQDIETYYTDKISVHGASPRGVDWKDEDGQLVRFEELLKVVDSDSFSLGDLGCGYGKLYDYLCKKNYTFQYYGYDLSEDMIYAAEKIYMPCENANFYHIEALENVRNLDYMVASGIFNVKMDHNESDWQVYILETLDYMHEKSDKGFAFNVLSKYSDKEFMRENLHYADPLFLFDYCKRNFSRNVALLHDYKLYEFTILVKKEAV